MRIALVTDSFYPTKDGVVVTVDTTRAELIAMGHDVVIFAPDPGKEYRQEGVVYFKAAKFKKYPGYFLPIFRSNKIELLKKFNPDVIHLYGAALMVLKGIIAARALKVPTVITYITSVSEVISMYSPVKLPEDLLKKLVWIYVRNLLKRPSAVIVPTRPIGEELKENGVNCKRLEVIHIGIDIERFQRNAGAGLAVRKKYDLEGKKVVICAGRLSGEKNIDMLIRSMKLLDDIVLMIVGKGPMNDSLRDLTDELELNERVIFTGFVSEDELVAHYSAADVTASASMFETQGLTTLEAMGCGLPAACVNMRAFSEVIKNGVNGYLFENSEEGCAEAIRKCFTDLPQIADGARKTAEINSIHETAVKLESLYYSVSLSKNGSD